MPRYTPLYRLPALAPADRLRDLADIDWSNAQAIESILANQGQPPLGSDLVSLVTRLGALEAATKPYAATIRPTDDVTVNGVTLVGQYMSFVSGQNIPSSAWSKTSGLLTIPSGADGTYLLSLALRFTSGPSQVQAFFGINGTGTNARVKFNDGLTNVISTATYELKGGDQVYPIGWSNASGKSVATATEFTVKRLV